MKRKIYFIFLLFFLVFATGCMSAPKATAIRMKLAVDTEQQLNQCAIEAGDLIKFAIAQKGDKAFSEHYQNYQNLIAKIKEQYQNDPLQILDKSAKAGADYIRGQQQIKDGLEAESNRLLLLVTKIQISARSINAINTMSDSEIKLQSETIRQIVQTGLTSATGLIITQLADKYSNTAAASTSQPTGGTQ